MLSFLYISIWVLLSVIVGVWGGYWIGRHGHQASSGKGPENKPAPEPQHALQLLTTILEATEKLTSNVDTHNNELAAVGREVGGWQLSGDLERVQAAVVGRILNVIESNKRLEDDLVCTRYQLENQAQEIDRHRREARTDALSGTANRKAFDEYLQYLLSNFNRQGEPFCLVLLDIDHFKWINDTHGHPAGDLVVQNVAACLKSLVRGADMVFRFGGDEFGVLLTKISDAAAVQTAQRIRQAVAQRNFETGDGSERVSVTCSLGLTSVRRGDSPAAIIGRADAALYNSKRGGRNQLQAELERPVELLPAAETPVETLVEPALPPQVNWPAANAESASV